MKIDITFEFKEYYLPNRRCKIEREHVMVTTAGINVQEVKMEDFPVALIVHDRKTRDGDFKLVSDEIRTFGGKLYALWREMSGKETGKVKDATELFNHLKWSSGYEYDYSRGYKENEKFSEKSIVTRDNKDEHVKTMQDAAANFLIDSNGMVWKRCGEPMYHIQTFGLGHNHGGTGFFIDFHYNPNCAVKSYFNALEYEQAREYFNKVAMGRGDTESVDAYKEDYIEVLMPEMITRNPKEEHGEGDSFMNALEDIISGSDSTFEAGLLVIAKTAAEIRN